MGVFIKIPEVDIGGPGEFITKDEAIYQSDKYGLVTIPPRFHTDFASIPEWVPRWLFDPMDHGRRAAIFHDYLCRTAMSYKERVIADHVFLEAMKDEGEGWRRYAMFSAVRANTYRMRLMRHWK